MSPRREHVLKPMPAPPPRHRTVLLALTAGALAVRIVAAFAVEWASRRKGTLCLFDDTDIYWQLAKAMRRWGPYEVNQFGVFHRALRMPGYPLFLAACQSLFGAQATMGARLVQALLGAACVPLVYGLVRQVGRDEWPRSAALIAAGLAAFEPYWAASAALLLSEAVFVPLMLAMLWGFAALWSRDGETGPGHARWIALGTGLAAGAAVMVKPSWALAVPAMMAAWILTERKARTLVLAMTVFLGVLIVMAPWWVRNERLFGSFVPTALWAGASLYDGLNPSADGSSNMLFLAEPEFKALGEMDQDRVLRERALDFALKHPGRVARLAVVKAGRYWSPWPNAATFRSTWINLASAIVTLPIFALLGLGIWTSRHDGRALVLLAGPLVYFFLLHLIFVSSIRYRIPAEVPAFGLVGLGWVRWKADS
ncbi:MAG: family glycosyltransferase, 4-amino-4-deoxy-L-arabinose transferase [Planctomycetota bacterium]|nr:family glycosyltransferase, 4-amino-4-deoxy-L-arabinose transferase [Planctomycetota bacterium]